MTQFFASFFTAAIAAIFVENTIFTRALGTSRMLSVIGKPKTMMKFGIPPGPAAPDSGRP